VGCAHCHTPQFTTGPAVIAAFDRKPVNLYSDLLVHRMGPGLADQVSQGQAGPDEFRTAPLWGVGQRLFYLHDGRATTLVDAIQAHASTSQDAHCVTNRDNDSGGGSCRSEANKVIEQFNKLTAKEQDDIVDFLKTL
jgi:CxxC motif-containing protein (DUF1111 family)